MDNSNLTQSSGLVIFSPTCVGRQETPVSEHYKPNHIYFAYLQVGVLDIDRLQLNCWIVIYSFKLIFFTVVTAVARCTCIFKHYPIHKLNRMLLLLHYFEYQISGKRKLFSYCPNYWTAILSISGLGQLDRWTVCSLPEWNHRIRVRAELDRGTDQRHHLRGHRSPETERNVPEIEIGQMSHSISSPCHILSRKICVQVGLCHRSYTIRWVSALYRYRCWHLREPCTDLWGETI